MPAAPGPSGPALAGAATPPLAPPQVASLLSAAFAAIREEFSATPEAALAWHPAPGEWCAKEVVGHLIEAERRGFAGRIRIILGADEPALERWDPDEVARARGDCQRDWRPLVAELGELRGESARLAASLTGPDLLRGGLHPTVGRLVIGDLLHEWVHHDRNHLRQIYANLQGFAWPHMGNAQQFSQP